MDSRPNFFELLGLDPAIDDWKTLETTLTKMKNRWTAARTQTNQSVREKAELGLSLLDEMERVFRDPALRREEAEALRSKRTAKAAEKTADLDRLIDRLRLEGRGCSEEQLQRLVERFRGVFEPETIRKKLEAAGIRVAAEGPRREFLDEQSMRNLDQRLKVCGQPNLYKLFGVLPSLPIEDLFHAAGQRYKEIIRVGKTDPVSTAEKELAGIAQDLFQSLEKKERYDNSLQARPMAQLREEIEHAGAFATIRERDLDALARRAVALGVDLEIARSYLLAYAEKKGWEVVVEPPPDPQTEMMRAAARAAEDAARAAREMQEEARRERERAEAERTRREAEERRPAAAAPIPIPTPTPQPTAPSSPTSGGGPPPAPSDLRVSPIPRGFRLTWEPVQSPTGPVQYVVVRKQGAIPQGEGDGEMVSPDLTMTRFEDATAPVGETVYYAVYSLRDEVISSQAAISSGVVARARGRSGAKWAAAVFVLLLIGAGALLQQGASGTSTTGTGGTSSTTVGGASGISSTSTGTSGSSASSTGTVSTGTSSTGGSIPKAGSNPRNDTKAARQSGVLGRSTHPGMAGMGTKPLGAKPLPLNPTVTVLGVGDPGIMGSFADLLTDDLGQRGFRVVRPSGLLSVKSLLRQGAGESEILQALGGEDVHVLVWAEAQDMGQRELRHLGNRTDTLFKTAIEVHAFLVPEQQDIGGGWREEVEYTSVNSREKAEQAMLAMGYDLGSTVEKGWQSYRQARP